MNYEVDGYYVYKFLDMDKNVIYVGRTINLYERLIKHSGITPDTVYVQYIECKTHADSLWKEIYYINYYNNQKMINKEYVSMYDKATDMEFNDEWIDFDISSFLLGISIVHKAVHPITEYTRRANQYNGLQKHLYYLEQNIYRNMNVDYYTEKFGDLNVYVAKQRERLKELHEEVKICYEKAIDAGHNIKKIRPFFGYTLEKLKKQREEIPSLQEKLDKKQKDFFEKPGNYSSERAIKTAQSTIVNLENKIESYILEEEFADKFFRSLGYDLDFFNPNYS